MLAEAATASAGGSGADDGVSSVVNQLPSWSRSGSGTPSSSLITVNGSGKAKPLTRSTTTSPRASRSSSSPSTMAWTRGRSAAIRGRLKAAELSRRSRVWSGGSTLSMCRAMTGGLLSRARAGDQDAFGELVGPYRRELQAHCYRILGSVPDAEDMVQETLLAAWRGLPGFEGRSSVG